MAGRKVEIRQVKRVKVQEAWNRIARGSEKHFNAGMEMELVRNPHSMGQYMTNYLAGEGKKDKSYQNKAPDWAKNVGRWWGTFNSKQLFPEKKNYEVNKETYKRVVQMMEQYIQEYNKEFELRDDSKFTLYLNNLENNRFMDAFLEVVLEDGVKDPAIIFEKAKKKIEKQIETVYSREKI
jgi:hypothetical protein